MHPPEPGFRFAALADIHGNLLALEAVLRDLRSHPVDAVVNLGDHLAGPLQPSATAELLMSLPFVHIRGNQDRVFLEPAGPDEGPTLAANRRCLTEDHLNWLGNQPSTLRWREEIFLCHGTPASDEEYLLEEVRRHGVRLAHSSLIRRRLGAAPGSLVLCAHSHIPRIVHLSAGQLIVNPGSVGLPAYTDDLPYPHRMESGSPHARYALLTRAESGWQVEQRSVVYDSERAARMAFESGRPDWAEWLRTGRAPLVRQRSR